MNKQVDYKNFSKVADRRVEGVKWAEKLTTAESAKFCEQNTETINRY